MKIKITALLLTLVTLLSVCSVGTYAAAPKLTVKADGKVIAFPDQAPTIQNDRTLVPIPNPNLLGGNERRPDPPL